MGRYKVHGVCHWHYCADPYPCGNHYCLDADAREEQAMVDTDFFDYATIMLRMDRLNKEIHDNLLVHKYAENLPLVKELLVQSRLLHLWHVQELEKHGHRNY